MKKTFIILSAIMLAVTIGCTGTGKDGKIERKVVQTYPNGAKMIVQDFIDSLIVGETGYYENGTAQYRKVYTLEGQRDSIWCFNYPDGNAFATADYSDGKQQPEWTLYDFDRSPLFKDTYDSMSVSELGLLENPATIVYYKGRFENEIQLFSNGRVRCRGTWLDHRRNGVWTYYHANGKKQTEAEFKDGLREGQYIVFHENGNPLYIGNYTNDHESGTWYFYDEEGNQISKKEYK